MGRSERKAKKAARLERKSVKLASKSKQAAAQSKKKKNVVGLRSGFKYKEGGIKSSRRK